MRRILLAGAVLALAGCDNAQQSWSRDEIRAIARDEAVRAQPNITALNAKIEALERQIALVDKKRIDGSLSSIERSQNALEREKSTSESIRRLFANDNIHRDHLNWLRSQHGASPMGQRGD